MESPLTAPQGTTVRLRSYQKEMVDASLRRNIILAMDTGSGKTHVAIARIAAELERSVGKLVFFLVPSVALADQQSEVLSTALPAYRVLSLTGRDGVDKWTSQALWDATLENVHVVVCTPDVLLSALTHAFVVMSRISLCVFDEAHRTTKKHPNNAIMQRFYHPAKQLGHVPHILGLTASPVTNSKKGSLEIIEQNLNAISATPKHTRAELQRYVNSPELTTVSYPDGLNDSCEDPVCHALAYEARFYDMNQDPYVLDLLDDPGAQAAKLLRKAMTKNETYCCQQLRTLDQRAASIAVQFGATTSRWYVDECISTFQQSLEANNPLIPDLNEKERTHLSTILSRVRASSYPSSSSSAFSYTHKVSELISILNKHASNRQSAIIFVEQRVHTIALAHLLQKEPDISKSYRIGSFVGTSVSSKRKILLADIVSARDQQKDLDGFRMGDKNLMIATSVLEEGIDVSACGLVICFDPPKNLVSFVQRRGRARKMDSKYFVFVSEDDMKQNGTHWEKLEAEMKKAYMDDTRKLAEDLDDELSLEGRTYRVSSTGALLTFDNAKGHLYHFCSVGTMQASNYVDLRPEFDSIQHSATALWTASVELPAFVHPGLRHAASAESWKTESSAVKDAAFSAYVALHQAGLVNDNLLPLVKDYGPDLGHQHIDQPSLVEVSERLSWPAWWACQKSANTNFSRYTVTIERNNAALVAASILLPSNEIHTEDIALYWNANTTYIAKFRPMVSAKDHLDGDELALLRKATHSILQSVHGGRMMSSQDDFAFLVAPNVFDVERWVRSVEGSVSAAVLHKDQSHVENAGLIRLRGQNGQAFFFEGFDNDAITGPSILTTTFPKRKDFLHPIADSAAGATAYTAKQTFSVVDCTMDNMPSTYALLAAFMPSIIHRVDTLLLANYLRHSILVDVGFDSTLHLLEAITSPAAGEVTDYNRLEYLGDAILKHRTELQVISQHPNWPEAYLTLERDRIVRNSNLAKSALELGLDKFIITRPFTGSKWRPIYISQILTVEPRFREMSTKTLADVMEALIGAAFVEGGFSKAQKCIDTLLPIERWHQPAILFDSLISELRPMSFQNRKPLERLVGHEFEHPTLLLEAITHASHPNIQSGLSYERLEFLGDSVLDMIITPKLFAHPRKLRHWDLHRVHEALVNSHFLGYCCMRYAIDEDIFTVVERPTGEHEIKQSTRQVHLHDFLRAGYQLTHLRRSSLSTFLTLEGEIHLALTTSNQYPWPALVTLNPQKFFCDMVESVLGAIYIDTRGDLSVCEAFVKKLGILDYMQTILNDHVETVSPKERLGAVADRDAVKYTNGRKEGTDGKKTWFCTVMVGEREVVTVDGCGTKDEAEVKAAFQACEMLGDRVGGATGKRKRKLEAFHFTKGAEPEDDVLGESMV